MAETRQLKINAPLRDHPAGSEITIRTNKKGVPDDPYWRRRLKDSATDDCVELLKPKAKKIAETKKKGE